MFIAVGYTSKNYKVDYYAADGYCNRLARTSVNTDGWIEYGGTTIIDGGVQLNGLDTTWGHIYITYYAID